MCANGQLPKTLKFYSRCKQCDMEKPVEGWIPPPFGSLKVKSDNRKYSNNTNKCNNNTLMFHSCGPSISSISYVRSFIADIYIAPLQVGRLSLYVITNICLFIYIKRNIIIVIMMMMMIKLIIINNKLI